MNDQSQKMNQQQQPPMMNQPPPMMNRSYGVWPPVSLPPPLPLDEQQHMKFRQGFAVPKPGRSNWKKKGGDKRKENRKGLVLTAATGSNTVAVRGGAAVHGGGVGGGGGYKPPTLHELQSQNRMKARRFYSKKKFNNNNNNNRFAPFAPRNTTSFIIRAKKSGGIASLVSPCPVTPAVLPTPIFSPSREVLVDMAKEEWGVNGYGSMNGLIRLRSPGHDEEEEEGGEGGGSSESDVEEHVEVERRLDHDLSRFEMIYPNYGEENMNLLENQVDDQDAHVAQLEEENLTLKERLYLMERELVDLRVRLQCLETESRAKKASNAELMDNEMEGGGDKEDENENNNNDEMLENENEAGGDKEENGIDGGSYKEENNNDEVSDGDGEDVCSEKSIGNCD